MTRGQRNSTRVVRNVVQKAIRPILVVIFSRKYLILLVPVEGVEPSTY